MGDDDELKGGEVVFAGNASWSMVGKKEKTGDFDGVEGQVLWGFERLKPLCGVKIHTVVAGCNSATMVAIGMNGECYTWGRNNYGQLGQGHTTNIYNPSIVDIPEGGKIKGGACGPTHTLLYSTEGDLYSCGAGKCGQLGVGRKIDMSKKFSKVETVDRIVKCAAGREFSMIVDKNGVIYSFGLPEYGCLGNGTEGKTLERANKFTFDCVTTPTPIVSLPKNYGDVKITDVACGNHHTVAMDQEGRIYTWGFGAYGRLGHKDNKNQMEPMAVELFSFVPPPLKPDVPAFMQHQQPKIRGVSIACGSAASFVCCGDPFNALYMFGITKRTGEAQMYPAVVANVQGWRCRSVSCGHSSMAVASERSLITWGPSPTYGELGYGEGEKKSSTVSDEVKALKGALTLKVASGTCQTLAIIDSDDEVSKERISALPIFDPQEVDPSVTAAAATKIAAARTAKKEKSKAAKKAAEEEAAEALGEEEEDEDEEDGADEEEDFDQAEDDDDDEDEDFGDEPASKKRRAK
mmetsp:Transcript_17856/g.28938  ORF Transcript_17856/g.28938 Transcript_17856/m.28938 type:complete len:520 (+) Transcript_17856:111-1670(+)|eukprot:CAMPEP_0203744658 /NCGR_PEP_ID=MMETSP0098-20131031/654_1 /ASSEMBLY_ACC=CAM_ASM_000208 /TAXON_ID=96639 /ORGANISM=" , Strain NY0313808BC1" /LENGTH=519 /DNA_ID=CAMNT_0050632235 /DNA_START=130 /DNA_END=1689 /DNA_ORIENTATION=+